MYDTYPAILTPSWTEQRTECLDRSPPPEAGPRRRRYPRRSHGEPDIPHPYPIEQTAAGFSRPAYLPTHYLMLPSHRADCAEGRRGHRFICAPLAPITHRVTALLLRSPRSPGAPAVGDVPIPRRARSALLAWPASATSRLGCCACDSRSWWNAARWGGGGEETTNSEPLQSTGGKLFDLSLREFFFRDSAKRRTAHRSFWYTGFFIRTVNFKFAIEGL